MKMSKILHKNVEKEEKYCLFCFKKRWTQNQARRHFRRI